MSKIVFALIATAVSGWVLAGSATSASAYHSRPGCNCGPNSPSRYYKTIQTAKSFTRYHDVSVYKNVHRIHRVVNVTRIQPIVHIHDVTRVHHHTIVQTSNAYENQTQYLPAIRYVDRSVQHYYDCSCGH